MAVDTVALKYLAVRFKLTVVQNLYLYVLAFIFLGVGFLYVLACEKSE